VSALATITGVASNRWFVLLGVYVAFNTVADSLAMGRSVDDVRGFVVRRARSSPAKGRTGVVLCNES